MKAIISNKKNDNIIKCIERLCTNCKEIKMAVGFLLKSGAKEFTKILKSKQIDLKCVTILFGTSFGITEPDALKLLYKQNINLLEYQGKEIYHPKIYCFKKKNHSEALIGSANLSASAWINNIEAMMHLTVNRKSPLEKEIDILFKSLEQKSIRVNEKTIKKYELKRKPIAYKERKIFRTIKKKQETEGSEIEKKLKEHGIVYDSPRKLIFKNRAYVFTGKFSFGTQDECKVATEKQGGSSMDYLSPYADVLVIGALGSPTYFWKRYGRKTELAVKWRKIDGRPLIISEQRWKKAL